MTRTVRQVDGEEELQAVRALCWDYREYLINESGVSRRVVEAFYAEDSYRTLMDALPDIHARPKGAILGLFQEGQMVGCGMSYEVKPGLAEIKRVYVSPEARGGGAGRQICEALVDQVRRDGYPKLVLDTAVSLTKARALYEAMGFRERGPFYDVPPEAEGAVCWYELDLQ